MVVAAIAGAVIAHLGCDFDTPTPGSIDDPALECERALDATTSGADAWELAADAVREDEEYADTWGDEAHLERIERTESWAARMNRNALGDLLYRCRFGEPHQHDSFSAAAARKQAQLEQRQASARRAQEALRRLRGAPG